MGTDAGAGDFFDIACYNKAHIGAGISVPTGTLQQQGAGQAPGAPTYPSEQHIDKGNLPPRERDACKGRWLASCSFCRKDTVYIPSKHELLQGKLCILAKKIKNYIKRLEKRKLQEYDMHYQRKHH